MQLLSLIIQWSSLLVATQSFSLHLSGILSSLQAITYVVALNVVYFWHHLNIITHGSSLMVAGVLVARQTSVLFPR